MTKTILITAYAINPYKGSEDGIGWNIVRSLAAHQNIVAITRENNGPHIESYLEEHPLPEGHRLRFEYFDLPYWMRFWKKGARGSSIYHLLWHFGVVFFILKKRFHFDLAHHLNFNADWSPSFLYLLGKPYVWGPVGHHHKIPDSYLMPHGKKTWIKDRLRWWIKCYFWKADPFLKLTKWTAQKVIALNSSVFEVMHVPAKKQVIIPAAGNQILEKSISPSPKAGDSRFQVLSVGRFVPLKGFDLTIQAFSLFFHRQNEKDQKRLCLTLIGKGPEKKNLLQLVQKMNLPKQAITFIDWLERSELDHHFSSSQLFLFPSHEGAGMVVPEALSYGLPVVVFDNYGPGEFVDEKCAVKVPYTSYAQSLEDFALALEKLFHAERLRSKLSQEAQLKFRREFTWEAKARQIEQVYQEVFNRTHTEKKSTKSAAHHAHASS